MTTIERIARKLCELDQVDPDQPIRQSGFQRQVEERPINRNGPPFAWQCYVKNARAVLRIARETEIFSQGFTMKAADGTNIVTAAPVAAEIWRQMVNAVLDEGP